MADQKDVIQKVVEVLNDGHKGFMDYELQNAAGLKRDEEGTSGGAIHRFWGDVKVKLGGGDHTLLETAEQGEDAAKEAYQKALAEDGISAVVRETLMKQQVHVLRSHDQIKALRDRNAA